MHAIRDSLGLLLGKSMHAIRDRIGFFLGIYACDTRFPRFLGGKLMHAIRDFSWAARVGRVAWRNIVIFGLFP